MRRATGRPGRSLQAKWFPVPDMPELPNMVLLEARCGQRGCCPELANALVWRGRLLPATVQGFVLDENLGAFRLSNRARDQWEKFARKGGAWREFVPKSRHARQEREPGAMFLSAAPRIGVISPFRIVCPMCGRMNVVCPPSERCGNLLQDNCIH